MGAKRRVFAPRHLDMIAQWPEDWSEYHTHGLESLAMPRSGCGQIVRWEPKIAAAARVPAPLLPSTHPGTQSVGPHRLPQPKCTMPSELPRGETRL